MFYIDIAIGQFWKRVASIIAVDGGHVEHLKIAFNMTKLHSKHRLQQLNMQHKIVLPSNTCAFSIQNF